MAQIQYHDLSDDVQHMIAKLETEVEELQYESNIYRWASLIIFLILVERVWDRLF